jgi:signal peptidase II
MTKLKRLNLIGLTIFAAVLLDQGSKYLAISFLEGKGVISIINDCLRFVLAENRGGFLSLGAAMSEDVRSLVFIFATAVFLVLFFVYTILDKKQTMISVVASSMIIGGGIGNLIDRISRDGAVIDFVNVGIGPIRTGIFNIADMAVLFGCILLMFCLRKNVE